MLLFISYALTLKEKRETNQENRRRDHSREAFPGIKAGVANTVIWVTVLEKSTQVTLSVPS